MVVSGACLRRGACLCVSYGRQVWFINRVLGMGIKCGGGISEAVSWWEGDYGWDTATASIGSKSFMLINRH
jgi:hypothetical protein